LTTTYHTNFIKFANRFDFRIFANVDSSKTTIRAAIARLEASINQTRQRHQAELTKYQAHINRIAALEDSLNVSQLSHYQRNRLQRELISLRNRPIEEPVYIPPASQIAELEVRKQALTEINLLFSGHLTVYTFGFDYLSIGNRQVAIKPKYNAFHLFASANAATPNNNSFNSLTPFDDD
jgi:hypothetical protein